MDVNSFIQTLSATIQAFTGLIGFAGAFYVFLIQKYASETDNIKARLKTHARHIRQVFQQIDEDFSYSNLEERIYTIGYDESMRLLENLINSYSEKELQKTVTVDIGKQKAQTEIYKHWIEIEKAFIELDTYNERNKGKYTTFFLGSFIICGIPLLTAFYLLRQLSYGLILTDNLVDMVFMFNVFGIIAFIISIIRFQKYIL